MKELDINKDYNNGGSLYLEDGYLYKVYDEISYFRESLNRNVSAIKDIYKSLKTLRSLGIFTYLTFYI